MYYDPFVRSNLPAWYVAQNGQQFVLFPVYYRYIPWSGYDIRQQQPMLFLITPQSIYEMIINCKDKWVKFWLKKAPPMQPVEFWMQVQRVDEKNVTGNRVYRRGDGQIVRDFATIELEQVEQVVCEKPPFDTGTVTGPGESATGSGDAVAVEEMATLTKTITSFKYPHTLIKWRKYRIYFEVKVPKSIADTMQGALDRCMEVAKARVVTVIAPFLTPATMGGLPGAIPGALAAATQAFTGCIAAVPEIYPHINKIKIAIKTNRNA